MDSLLLKETFSIIAIILTFIGFYPYIKSILQNKTKPHVFSWVIWAFSTSVIFLAQLADGIGVGSWSIGVSALITIYIAILSYLRKADIEITKSDWIFFILGMAALPLWYITSNPLWAVLILTSVDLAAYVPTFRKSYNHPQSENLTAFFIMTLRNAVALLAIENYTLTTTFFQYATGLANILLITMVLFKRKIFRN